MLVASELGKEGLWIRAAGTSIRAVGPHDTELQPVIQAILGRGGQLRVSMWEISRYDVGLEDSLVDRESRLAFAEAHPAYRRCVIVPDILDEALIAPVTELIAGGLEGVERRALVDRRQALDWLRELDPSVPLGVPAWRTSRPPPPTSSR